MLFNPVLEGLGGSCLSQEYTSESERNSATGARIRFLQSRSPAHSPLYYAPPLYGMDVWRQGRSFHRYQKGNIEEKKLSLV